MAAGSLALSAKLSVATPFGIDEMGALLNIPSLERNESSGSGL